MICSTVASLSYGALSRSTSFFNQRQINVNHPSDPRAACTASSSRGIQKVHSNKSSTGASLCTESLWKAHSNKSMCVVTGDCNAQNTGTTTLVSRTVYSSMSRHKSLLSMIRFGVDSSACKTCLARMRANRSTGSEALGVASRSSCDLIPNQLFNCTPVCTSTSRLRLGFAGCAGEAAGVGAAAIVGWSRRLRLRYNIDSR
ncbi:hypothetical protein BDZ85DRAFT_77389 [Elsinoe ampelina]|uniref:Uncharacterized protein n=1 Tax=Elsinoe ampelina TaxID=302913 RepID=A0A6A6FZ28_9PEZI|nr:hypothetical protein BDZ85DRAFT_77389 [Elsinoe ampelina]